MPSVLPSYSQSVASFSSFRSFGFRSLSVGLLLCALLCAGCNRPAEQQDANTSAEADVDATSVKTYRVVSNASYPPFEILDEQGKVEGFDVDILKAIGKEEGFDVEFRSQPWLSLFADLENHKADIIASSVWITDERKQKYGVSNPYYSSPMALLTKSTDDNVPDNYKNVQGKVIAVAIGSENDAFYNDFLQENNNSKLQSDSSFLAFKNLVTDQADYVSDSVIRLNYNIKSYEDADTAQSFAIMTDPDFPVWEWGFIVNKDNPELLKKINSGLQKIQENGTYDKIEEKWLKKAL